MSRETVDRYGPMLFVAVGVGMALSILGASGVKPFSDFQRAGSFGLLLLAPVVVVTLASLAWAMARAARGDASRSVVAMVSVVALLGVGFVATNGPGAAVPPSLTDRATRAPALGLSTPTTQSTPSASATSADVTESPSVATEVPTAAPTKRPPPSATAPPLPTSKTAKDPAGDAPGYIDIVQVDIRTNTGLVTLAMELAADVPSVSTNVEQLAYVFYLDIDDDASWDFTAHIENLENGGFNAVFFDRAAGGSFEGARFPGPATLADRDISLGLSLDDLGCPEVIAVRAATESIRGDTKVGDAVPNSASKWLRISTGC